MPQSVQSVTKSELYEVDWCLIFCIFFWQCYASDVDGSVGQLVHLFLQIELRSGGKQCIMHISQGHAFFILEWQTRCPRLERRGMFCPVRWKLWMASRSVWHFHFVLCFLFLMRKCHFQEISECTDKCFDVSFFLCTVLAAFEEKNRSCHKYNKRQLAVCCAYDQY